MLSKADRVFDHPTITPKGLLATRNLHALTREIAQQVFDRFLSIATQFPVIDLSFANDQMRKIT